ncbi:MAG: penicillin acylase family protein [Alphaproteobacteria bacterium]|nr:penicillin acylase family protein [Alphaproteobacteria bacterium]
MFARWIRLIAGTAMGAVLAGCAVLAPLPTREDVSARLRAIPTKGAPLEGAVTIYWNDNQVPFIEAASDDDLAVTLGIVHAHLRLGQMEIARRISQGRIAEMGGPLATDIDHALRILNFGKGIPQTIEMLPPETKRWLDRFVDGVNYYIDQADQAGQLPHEFRVLGFEKEPWTVADVLTLGRLASIDVNWLVLFGALKLRQRPDWPDVWATLTARGSHSVPSYGPGASAQKAALDDILAGFSKAGSNAVAVAGWRTKTGAALMANDPHLGVFLPNLWLLAGYKSPSYHTVGMMIPGVPFMALGRNNRIAWGGTNMRALSSDLVDVSKLPPEQFSERDETIGVRWWFDRDITVRETSFGPVISDAPLIEGRDNETLALRWMGHRASDEVTAMLKVSQARNWDEFRGALDGFWVPGQNMLYADVDGHIGQVMAVRLPRRPAAAPDDMVVPANGADYWQAFSSAATLPAAFDPPEGYLASANNKPAETDIAVGWFFSNDDRITRLRELLSGDGTVDVADLEALQRDVYMGSAVALRDILLARLPDLPLEGGLTENRQRIVDLLRGWDGHYRIDSAGALAFELVTAKFIEAFLSEDELAVLTPGGHFDEFLGEELIRAEPARVAAALGPALDKASEGVEEFGVWGEMHRLGLRHPLGFIPVVGERFRFTDVPVGGSSSTLMKTAHSDTTERHFTRFGSQARHISDLSDPDANYFALLGGQDGWFNSTTFLDQFELWQRGDYVRLPLRLETVRAEFPHRTELTP